MIEHERVGTPRSTFEQEVKRVIRRLSRKGIGHVTERVGLRCEYRRAR